MDALVARAVQDLKNEIDASGIGGFAEPAAQLCDHLHNRSETAAGGAKTDLVRIVSLLAEVAEIAQRYQ
jgi:hypothetical protein